MIIIIFLILGYLSSLIFPPYFIFPIGFIIFPLLCIFVDKFLINYSKYKQFIYLFSFSFTFFLNLLFWIKNPFFIYEETNNIFFLSFLLIVFLALVFSLIFIFILNFNKFVPAFFIVPLIFIINEYVLSVLFYGFPWTPFALIISGNNFFAYSLQNFGTLINSYLLIQLFCLPYLFINKKYKYEIIYSIIFLIIPLGISLLFNIAQGNDKDIYTKKITAEIIQLNSKPSSDNYYLNNRYSEMIQIIKSSNANIIIFAENNYPFLINLNELQEIQGLLTENQTIVIGGTRKENNKYFNTILNINSSEVSYFDKKILVPFGEFLPFRNLIGFLNIISGPNDYSIGNQERLITIDKNLNYIPVICYEIIFYWKLINERNFDSDLIINITNDIWFGKYLGPYQHFYLTKLRAAEFNKPVIRVSNNGISAIFNSDGKILKKTSLNQAETITYSLNINQKQNYFNTHNLLKYYFILTCIILFSLNLKKNES